MSHYFGIRPPDVGQYSAAELRLYLNALRQITEDARRSSVEADRMRR